jgi:hypothetical protein
MYYWLIAFLGLIFGIFLGKYTKEELKEGKKYFILLEKAILFVLILFLLYGVSFSFLVVIFSLLGVLLARKLDKVYFYLGLTFVLVSDLSVSALIFIFGLPYGSLLYHSKKIKEWNWDLLYFAIPLVLLLVNDFVSLNIEYFLAFTSGALFYRMIRKS